MNDIAYAMYMPCQNSYEKDRAILHQESTSLSTAKTVTHTIAEYLQSNPNIFGGIDIYLLDMLNPLERVGGFVANLFGLAELDGRRAVHKYLIIVPPDEQLDHVRSVSWQSALAAFESLARKAIPNDAADWLQKRILVQPAPDLRTVSILNLLNSQPDRTAIIVTEAAKYRDDSVVPVIPKGTTSALLSEDVWVPQLHNLARQAALISQSRSIYVALDADKLSPNRPQSTNLLLSIDNCGVVGSERENGVDAIIGARIDQWDAWINDGHLGRALQDVNALPTTFDSQKKFLTAQILHRAGHNSQALEAIREELFVNRQLDDASRIKLSIIAKNAGAGHLALELLVPSITSLTNQEDLEGALQIAYEIDANELEQQIADRLERLFPSSPGWKERQKRILMSDQDYATLATIAEDEDHVFLYRKLREHITEKEIPDYMGLIESAGHNERWAEFLRMAAIDDALARGWQDKAFDLALPEVRHQDFRQQRDLRLTKILEDRFVAQNTGQTLSIPTEDIQFAVLSLIESLSKQPDNQHFRIELTNLLEPMVSGTNGLALLAAVVIKLAGEPIEFDKHVLPGRTSVGIFLENKALTESLFSWLESEAPIVIGRLTLPVELLTISADDAVSGVADYIQSAPIASNEDVGALQSWLALGATIAPHSSDPDFDLRLLRLAAGKLAISGFPQLARDLTEQALLNSTQSMRRRRLGWFTMADVYHRAGSFIEALLALACTFASSTSVDEEEAFQETVGLIRHLRDLGLVQQAEIAIERARELLTQMKLTDKQEYRIDTLELQIRQLNLRGLSPKSPQFQTLLKDSVSVAEEVLSGQHETEPVASVLGQLLRRAREAAAPTPVNADAVLSKLIQQARGYLADQLRVFQEQAPTADDLLNLLNDSRSTRASEDVGVDTRTVALLASRSLSNERFLMSADDVSFGLELLADRGVAVPGWDEVAEPPPAPSNTREPGFFARQLSREGLSVVQAGWDENGRMVRLETANGEFGKPTREPEELVDQQRFLTWSSSFPYAYGLNDANTNLFYTTTEDLRFTSIPEGPVVLVGGVGFQAFPPNLLFVDDNFAGRTRPIASAPSLSWLRAARDKAPIGDGRRCAWISTAVEGGSGTSLTMIAQRLEPTLQNHGFALDNGPALPKTFSGASIAMIAAHGGVHPEGRYFRVISDEGVLRVGATDFANAVRNVAMVILFVCSAGRADKHPAANTVLGLAKQILDRGCTAVLASPWPLDARVPAHWLPPFLQKWEQGATLIEANFAANAAVDRSFALDPARGLAMTLFGVPDLTNSETSH